MLAKMECVDERFETIDFKKGARRVRRLTLVDTSRPAYITTLDWEPDAEALAKVPPEGKVVGHTFTMWIRNIVPGFGGRVNVVGSLADEAAVKSMAAQPQK